MTLGRILGIDYGQKRVGIAVTDPLQIIANGLTTVGVHEVFSFLSDYFAKEQVDEVVIGFPRQMNHQPSESAVFVDSFITGFKRKFKEIPITLIDERFTSKMAFQTMIDGGLKKKDRQNKALIDTVSATIILQSYLEQKKLDF